MLVDKRFRFLVAGGGVSALNWGFGILFAWMLPYVLAVALATVIAMAVGFFVYGRWVFEAEPRPLAERVPPFLIVNGIGAAITVLVAVLIESVTRGTFGAIAGALGHGIGIGAGAVATYMLHNRLTFAKR